MKKLITTIALFIVAIGFSQTTITKSSIGSGGASVANGTTTVIYSLGEVAVQETNVGNIYISEGFISSSTLDEALNLENYTQLEGIKVFPNPTTNFVNIKFKTIDNFEISLFDTNGKQIFKTKINQTNTQQLDLESYDTGIYLLVIKNTVNQVFKTYKLIKK